MKTHAVHFVVLGCILVGGIALFYLTRGIPSLQLLVGIVTSLSYIAWGIIHHALSGDLHPKIVIEYVLIGSIAILVFSTMLL